MHLGILNVLAAPLLVGAMSLAFAAAYAQTEQGGQVVNSARRASSSNVEVPRTRSVDVQRTRVGASLPVLESDNVPAGAKQRRAGSPRMSEVVSGPAIGDELPVPGALRR
jgi:hypothetical protein